MPDDRTYIRVHDGIEDHPKVAALSDKAFRLLVTTWGWSSRHRTNGHVPIGVWKKRSTSKARAELVSAGLAHVHADDVLMHDYLEHQRSAEEIAVKVEAKSRAGALGNHNRWHESQGKFDPKCVICVANGQSAQDHDLGNESNLSNANDTTNASNFGQKGESKSASHMRSTESATPAETVGTDDESASHMRSHERSQRDRKTSPETETETEVLVETFVGGVTESNASEKTRPRDRCSRHTNDPSPPPCRGCGDARLAAEAWDRAQALRRSRCQFCDGDGYRFIPGRRLVATPYVRCDHSPPEQQATG